MESARLSTDREVDNGNVILIQTALPTYTKNCSEHRSRMCSIGPPEHTHRRDRTVYSYKKWKTVLKEHCKVRFCIAYLVCII
jgi:hypothetical protein